MLAMYRLQDIGVAAGAVVDAVGLRSDPQVNSRALLGTVEQPDVGLLTLPRTPIRFDGRYPELEPAPGLGQHNDEILTEAGFGDDERATLRSLGVVTDEPPES
jgi:crotonobetainyl-CoA:carnitine CoA-transferase CaiB-like acyl-CoA transferase